MSAVAFTPVVVLVVSIDGRLAGDLDRLDHGRDLEADRKRHGAVEADHDAGLVHAS